MNFLYRHFVILIFTVAFSNFSNSQTISGTILDDKGLALPFASILVVGQEKGAVSNLEGQFILQLEQGEVKLKFQFVGYKTVDTTLYLQNDIKLRIRMKPESLTLPLAIITGDNEDPAYTIMRRTIAKAPYHANFIDSYNALVYLKGSGRLLKTPFLFKNRIKKELAKEGIDSTVAFTQESVSKVNYKRPDQYKDTVISIRTSGESNNSDPMGFVYSSFYEPKVSGSVSPLAPNAFQIYNFEYLGFIEENGTVINKIKVMPKGKGDQVFEGTIYIVDQLWSIHSLDLVTSIWGIEFAIKQIFSKVQESVWMPVDQIYDVNGNVFGFGFTYKYLAHLSNYKIKLNPDISVPILVLDNKLEKIESQLADKKIEKKTGMEGLSNIEPGTELSAKKLRKMMKEYEKKEVENLPTQADSISLSSINSEQTIDSIAYHRDSLYWENIRPVVLTDYEVKGYSRLDSISIKEAETKSKTEDTTSLEINMNDDGETSMKLNKGDAKKFEWSALLVGARYPVGKKHYFSILPTLLHFQFNSVDGYHLGSGVEIGSTGRNKKTQWLIRPQLRYAFSREAFNYRLFYSLQNKRKNISHDMWKLTAEAGNMVQSFNPFLPPDSPLNSIYSLIYKKNYLKLFEKKYIRTDLTYKFSPYLNAELDMEYADRLPLENSTNHSWANRKKNYSANIPDISGIDEISFQNHEVFRTDFALIIKPFQKYIARNGLKVLDDSRSPVFRLAYHKGWSTGDSEFDQIDFNLKQNIHIGAGDDWDLNISAGSFLGTSPLYAADFKHFAGNQYAFSPMNTTKYFRMLPYHTYSTNGEYFSFLTNYQFRRFLITRIPVVRRKGIRENIILNGLKTSTSNMYGELGYSINYLFRFLRIEAVTSWDDYKYKDFSIRFGLATGFQNLFKF